MTDTKSGDDKTLSVNTKKTLTMKRPEQGTVRQSFSHGRTKAVVVETKKRKFSRTDEQRPEPAVAAEAAPAPEPAPRPQPQPQQSQPQRPQAPAPRPQQPRPQQSQQRPQQGQRPARPQGGNQGRAGVVLNSLSQNEMEARRRALQDSRVREAEERQRAEIEAKRRAAEEEQRNREAEESRLRQAEEDARLKTEEAARKSAEAEAQRRADAAGVKRVVEKPAQPAEAAAPGRGAPAKAVPGARAPIGKKAEEDDRPVRRGAPKVDVAPRPVKPRVEDDKRRGKLTLNTALSSDEEGRSRSLSAMRRRQEKFKRSMQQETREKVVREVILPETITVQELAQRMAERAVDVVKYFMKQGQIIKPGDVIDADTAELVATDFGHTVKRVAESDVEDGMFNIIDDDATLLPRAPVITIMGHVDHGKTSLLDAIRHANVASGEAGGITQHIGAYQVMHNGNLLTFLDTPGHEAFTAMRARGAQATDIAVLVVAADDSVMPQTIESINHAKAAGVPIIVAINKIDKPAADPQKVRTQLLQHEVFVESLGGEVLDVEVSAAKKTGIDKLLEALQLQSEILELRANADRTAEGVVIEAKLDRGRGPVATVLVQKGTLRGGDIVVLGKEWGRVRALVDDRGNQVKEAGPSKPVEILGLQGTPQAGDRFAVVDSEARAREISEYRQRKARDRAVARQAGQRGSLEQMMTQLQASGLKEFPLIVKGDVQGSIEAIVIALGKLGNDEVRARIVHSAAGAITESDVSLAETSGAVIIGFNVRANKQARDAAEQGGIEIRYYNIIYDLVDDIKAAMSGLLSPERRETFLGNAEILEVFNITKVGKVAGCRVTEGKVERGAGVRLIRDNVVIHEGKLKTLKRFKDEVSEVQVGQECGMAFENYEDIRAGDVIEAFRVEHITRTL